jgi:hypothetical protein
MLQVVRRNGFPTGTPGFEKSLPERSPVGGPCGRAIAVNRKVRIVPSENDGRRYGGAKWRWFDVIDVPSGYARAAVTVKKSTRTGTAHILF